jgi:hypothetical protein
MKGRIESNPKCRNKPEKCKAKGEKWQILFSAHLPQTMH